MTQKLSRKFQPLERFYSFFFIRVSPLQAALLRVTLGTVAFLNVAMWSGYVGEVFGDQGFFPNSFIANQISAWDFSILLHISNDRILWMFYGLLLTSTLCFTLGVKARLSNAVMYFLLLAFHARAPLIHNGPINLLCIGSFFTLFLRTDRALTLFPTGRSVSPVQSVEGWPIRILQIQIALVYLCTSIEKIHLSPQWVNGSYLFYVLTWPPYSIYDMSWLRKVPTLVNLANWFVLFSELLFFFWIWFKPTRRLALICVSLMHIGIVAFMNVDYFGETIMAFYVVFLTDEECKRVIALCQKGFRWFSSTYWPRLSSSDRQTPAQ